MKFWRPVRAGRVSLDEARHRIWADWRHTGAGYPQEPRDDEYEAEWAAVSWRQRYGLPALLAVVVIGLLVAMRML